MPDGTHRAHEDLGAMCEPAGADRQDRRTGKLRPLDVDGLHIAAVVADRLDSPQAELGPYVFGGKPLVARATPTAVQRIAREKLEMRANGRFRNGVAVSICGRAGAYKERADNSQLPTANGQIAETRKGRIHKGTFWPLAVGRWQLNHLVVGLWALGVDRAVSYSKQRGGAAS
jgi:hypothetical protein